MFSSSAWAFLTPLGPELSTEDVKSVSIDKNEFIVGRSKTADLVIDGKKMISAKHFVIRRLTKSGFRDEAILEDCSTNGTLLNSDRIIKKSKVPLTDGDTINIVFGKAAHGLKNANLGYVFRLVQPQSSGVNPEEEEEDLEKTQQFEDSQSQAVSPSDNESAGTRKRPSEDEGGLESKRQKTEIENVASGSGQPPGSSHLCSVQPSGSGQSNQQEQDDMEENLICCICQDILHDCVSVQPCMHCFCGGCYSDWMKRSKLCPQCRKPVQHVAKNHTVNNLVQAYLKMRPEKRRDLEDLHNLDSKNTIKEGLKDVKSATLTKLRGTNVIEVDDGDDDDEDISQVFSISSDDEDDNDYTSFVSSHPLSNMPRVKCPQCVSVPAAEGQMRGFQSTIAGTPILPSASSSSGSALPPPPAFQCQPSQLHINCGCCRRPMPDRRSEPINDSFPALRRQSCCVCASVFCHAYFGCPGCTMGCLIRLKDAWFPPEVMGRLLIDSQFESKILTDHLASKRMTKEDLFDWCVSQLDSGQISLPSRLNSGLGRPYPGMVVIEEVKGDSLVCYNCALKFFKEIAYSYRAGLSPADLPLSARRPDCWWGHECRTAKTKPEHAAKLNHICEKTGPRR